MWYKYLEKTETCSYSQWSHTTYCVVIQRVTRSCYSLYQTETVASAPCLFPYTTLGDKRGCVWHSFNRDIFLLSTVQEVATVEKTAVNACQWCQYLYIKYYIHNVKRATIKPILTYEIQSVFEYQPVTLPFEPDHDRLHIGRRSNVLLAKNLIKFTSIIAYWSGDVPLTFAWPRCHGAQKPSAQDKEPGPEPVSTIQKSNAQN